MAEKAGLNLPMVAKALAAGGTGSPNVSRSSMLMVEANHEENVVFNAFWRLKDTQYGVKLADKMGQSVSLGQEAQALFQKLVDAGYSQSAESKIIDVLRD